MENSNSGETKQFTIEDKFNFSPPLLLVLKPAAISILSFKFMIKYTVDRFKQAQK